jgi:hypothetical protein
MHTLADYRAAPDALAARAIERAIAAAATVAYDAYQADPSDANRDAFISAAATDCAVAYHATHGEPWRA